MHLVPKVNRMLVFLVETPHKLCGWHARRRHVHVHCVASKLEEEWPQDDMPERGMATLTAWVSRMLYNNKDFDPKEKRCTKDLYPLAPVSAAQTSSTCFCSTPPFTSGNNKKADYILYECFCLSLLYNTTSYYSFVYYL